MAVPLNKRVLAIDPYTSGVGFAVLEGPENLIDWGLRNTKGAHNGRAVEVLERLIERFAPDVLALEAWEAEGSRRRSRVRQLLHKIATDETRTIQVHLVTIRMLRAIGPSSRTNTKFGRACLLAERFPELQAFLPPFRKVWMSEDSRTSIFDALGFALACYGTPKGNAVTDIKFLPPPKLSH